MTLCAKPGCRNKAVKTVELSVLGKGVEEVALCVACCGVYLQRLGGLASGDVVKVSIERSVGPAAESRVADGAREEAGTLFPGQARRYA